MSGNRWRWGGGAAGAAGGGGGARCAYPVLAAAPRRMGKAVSRCAVALRRTAAGPAVGPRTMAPRACPGGGRRPAGPGEGARAAARRLLAVLAPSADGARGARVAAWRRAPGLRRHRQVGSYARCVVDMCVLEPMPAARAHAVRARAVHPRAGRVVHLCSVRSDRATFARHHRRHLGGAPARALCWRCACRARAVPPRAGRVVHLCSVRSDRAPSARHHRRHLGGAPARALCWRCACLRCRACVPHAPVACTCCTCACCACLRYARLHFPCSRCVHLLCLPLLCVPELCVFVRCVVCLCSARLHRAALVDVADTTFLEDPGALTYRSDDRPDTYSPCLCSFLDPLQRTDPLDFDKHWPRGSI